MEEDSSIPDFCLARVVAWMQAKEHEQRRAEQERDETIARRHLLPGVPMTTSSVNRPSIPQHELPLEMRQRLHLDLKGVNRRHLHLPSKSPGPPTFRLEVLTDHSSPRGHSSQRSSSAANPEISSRAFAPQPLNRADIIISRTKASSRPSIHLSSDSIPSSIRRNVLPVQRRVTIKQMYFPVPSAPAHRPATGIHEHPENAAVCGAGYLMPRHSVSSRTQSP